MTNVDTYLPQYEVAEKHEKNVKSTPEKAYHALQKIDFADSFVTRLLFWLRGLPSNSFDEVKNHFAVLHDEPSKEIVLGIIARPWQLKKEFLKCSKEEFSIFNEPNYAKFVWSFSFKSQGKETIILTETRVSCTDEASKKKFRIYWFFARPLSGIVRTKILKLLQKSLQENGQ